MVTLSSNIYIPTILSNTMQSKINLKICSIGTVYQCQEDKEIMLTLVFKKEKTPEDYAQKLVEECR